jgi:hypothetical protein
MESYVITSVELEGMTGLSCQARVLYLYLRTRMDLRSRLVGKFSRISYKSCQEALEEYRPKNLGHQIISYTIDQIRTALDALDRAGLIQRTSTPMVFLLAKARGLTTSAFARSKETPHILPKEKSAKKPAPERNSSQQTTVQSGNTPHTSVVGVPLKSIAIPQPAPASVSHEAAAALGWMEKHSNGYRVAKPNHANVEKYEQLFRAGPEAVATATHTAAARRAAENSAAPLQPGLVMACLPKGCFIPKPPPLAARTASRSTPRPEIPPLVIDEAAVARGNTLMARFAAKRSHSEVRA